jgi:hypothetical protein
MPEDELKEPTAAQEQKRFESCVDKSKKRTKSMRFKEPRLLANFIMSHDPAHVWLDGLAIKRIYSNLSMSVKSINEMMDTEEFKKERDAQIPEVTKVKAGGMFNAVLLKYFESQLKLVRGPDAKALAIFGQISGRYSPLEKMEIYDGQAMDKEREKERNEEVVRALLNKWKRENEAKEVKPKDGGNG